MAAGYPETAFGGEDKTGVLEQKSNGGGERKYTMSILKVQRYQSLC
jgi:hypothetical protein